MHRLSFLSLGVALAVALATPVSAQRGSVAAHGFGASFQPHTRLGGGSILGYGGGVEYGLSSRTSIGLSAASFPSGTTESPRGDAGREYGLTFVALDIRSAIIGKRSHLAFLVNPSVARYCLEPWGGAPREPETLPMLGVGVGLRIQVAGPLAVDLDARDWISHTPDNALGALPGSRGLSHSPEIRLGASLRWRPKPRIELDRHPVPVAHPGNFIPVPASTTQREPYASAGGRDHRHRADASPEDLGGHPVVVWTRETAGVVYYDLGDWQVSAGYRPLLRDAAAFLEQYPDARLELRSYTDPAGSGRANLSLAERRGTEIREQLVRLHGIRGDRIDVVAVGVDDGADSTRQARRVEMVVRVPQER